MYVLKEWKKNLPYVGNVEDIKLGANFDVMNLHYIFIGFKKHLFFLRKVFKVFNYLDR